MGTKNNPCKYDCYANAGPDEPLFTLLARDRLAGHMVSLWSKIRNGDMEAATSVFMDMLNKNAVAFGMEPDVDKASAAMECSLAMFKWRRENKPDEYPQDAPL